MHQFDNRTIGEIAVLAHSGATGIIDSNASSSVSP